MTDVLKTMTDVLNHDSGVKNHDNVLKTMTVVLKNIRDVLKTMTDVLNHHSGIENHDRCVKNHDSGDKKMCTAKNNIFIAQTNMCCDCISQNNPPTFGQWHLYLINGSLWWQVHASELKAKGPSILLSSFPPSR